MQRVKDPLRISTTFTAANERLLDRNAAGQRSAEDFNKSVA